MQRKILGISVMDKMKNEELRRRSGMGEAATKVRRLKWSWDVRVARMDLDRWGLRRNYVGPETRKKVAEFSAVHYSTRHEGTRVAAH